MLDALSHLFALVCGQNPGHTWAPGGMPLPCCQRCTGLYVGAGVAALLHLWLRPKPTARFLEIHAVLLLAMAPFGFHWVADTPMLRTVTGILFGFGVVTFLRLPLASSLPARAPERAMKLYFLVLGALVLVVPRVASAGGRSAGYAFSALVTLGAAALFGLAAANVVLGLRWAIRSLRRRVSPRVAA